MNAKAIVLAATATLTALTAPVLGAPIRTLPDLLDVTIYEITYVTTPVSFAPYATQLTSRLSDPLGLGNRDFGFHELEHYDAFYSDAAGNLNINGSYLTIEGTLENVGLGGMNINEVKLNFGGATPHSIFADFVGSYVYGVGDGQVDMGSESRAVDGNLGTFPRFGYTENGTRFRLTVGFTGISEVAVPESAPNSLLMAIGTGAVLALSRRARARGCRA